MKKELITYEDPKSPISEVFKTLRTNLQFMKHKGNAISLLVTSTMPGEGKSWIVSNLGIAFAQSNKKTVIIDSDMRKGRVHNIFDTKIFPGLSNYLAEESKSIKDYLIKTEVDNYLWVLPAGNVPPNPSELLSSERMIKGLEELKEEFDVIIFDSTPCILVTDAIIISRIVDATVIVSAYKKTKIENLKQVQRNIENVGGKIAGVVINKIPVSMKEYKNKYYYYEDKTKELPENKTKRLPEGRGENILDNKEDKNEEREFKVIDAIEEAKENENEESDIKDTKVEIKIEKENEEIENNADIINQIDEYLKSRNKRGKKQ